MEHKRFGIEIPDTTDKLVYGHEGWLEEYPSHYHAGDPIMAKLKWGHNMEIDGLPRKEDITFRAYAPDGSVGEIQVDESGHEWLDLTADTDQEGFYLLVCTYNNCYAEFEGNKWKRGSRKEHPDAKEVRNYHQNATTCISVGHHHETDLSGIPELRISLLPLKGPKYYVGEEVRFQLKIDGKPAAKQEALLVHPTENGLEETTVTCDDNGQFTICPKEAGLYDLIARYRHEEKKEGEYEGESLTASHCFKVVEKVAHHAGEHYHEH